MPSIAIVIPAYNESIYISDCLNAIADQSDMPDQVIVVDNNSTDSTASVAKSFGFADVIQEHKQGIVYARNTGFNYAKTDIIARIDSDTRLPPDWVEKTRQFFAQNQNAKAVTGYCDFYDSSFPGFYAKSHNFVYYQLQAAVTGHMPLWGSNMAITRQLWEDVKHSCNVRTDIHEDIDLSLNIYKKGIKVRYNGDILAHVSLRRVHTDFKSLKIYLKSWPNAYRVNKRFISAPFIYMLSFMVLAGLATHKACIGVLSYLRVLEDTR